MPLKPAVSERTDDSALKSSSIRVSEYETPTIESGKSLAEICWANRNGLARLSLWALLVSLAVSLLWPKTWISDARLMPPEEKNNSSLAALMVGKAADTMPQGLSDLLPTKSSGALFVGVLRSETVENRLIDVYDLRRVYRVSTYEQARQILEDRTSIVEDRKSGIISVYVADRNPVRARDLCSAYVEQLNRLVAELSTSSARRERIFLEGRLKEVNSSLQDAEKQLSEFSSKHATLDVTEQAKAMLQSAAAVQGELIAAQSELQGMEAIYTPNSARVRALRARVGELQHQLERLGGTSGESTDQSGQLYPSLRQLPILGVTYSDLFRQAKIQETVYEVLTKQYEMARVQEAKEIPTVRVLDPPLVPERKSSPKRAQIVLAGVILALLARIGWFAARRKWGQIDPGNRRKLLLQEIAQTAAASLRRTTRKLVQARARGRSWRSENS